MQSTYGFHKFTRCNSAPTGSVNSFVELLLLSILQSFDGTDSTDDGLIVELTANSQIIAGVNTLRKLSNYYPVVHFARNGRSLDARRLVRQRDKS